MSKTTYVIFSLFIDAALFLPNISIEVRRLHDAGKSGWWAIGSLLAMMLMLYSLLEGIKYFADSFEAISALIGLFYIVSLPLLIVLIIFWCRPSEGPNKWGAPPRPPMFRR